MLEIRSFIEMDVLLQREWNGLITLAFPPLSQNDNFDYYNDCDLKLKYTSSTPRFAIPISVHNTSTQYKQQPDQTNSPTAVQSQTRGSRRGPRVSLMNVANATAAGSAS
jgi:hypothetical protein